MSRPLTPKQAAFVAEYLIDLNAAAAARRAGYSEKTANRIGTENLSKPVIAAAIEVAQAERAERTKITADDVLKRLWLMASADTTELSRVRISACRRCHGEKHQYQWTAEAEYHQAHSQWDADAARAIELENAVPAEPSDAGGYGYSLNLAPNPDCPHCLGTGKTEVVFGDTNSLSEAARTLYTGAKYTQAGIEIKIEDRMRALELVGRHLGMFVDRVDHTTKGERFAQPVQVYLPSNGRDDK